MAQTDSMPNSRESVKAEARAANKNTSNTTIPQGEASTVTKGQPNALPGPSENSRAMVKGEARAANRNAATTTLPQGEASTKINNQPNAAERTGALARSEVRPPRGGQKPVRGETGERPNVPTNPPKGGTPQ